MKKIDDGERTKIEGALKELKDVLAKEDVSKEQIDEKVKVLTEASHKLAEAMYKKDGGADAGTAGASGAKKDDDDVIDAEVETEDDKK